MDQKLKKMTFTENDSLHTAIDCCLAGAKKVSFCVDSNGKLLGILTQGDLLRVLKTGVDLDQPAKPYINTNPVTVGDYVSTYEAKKLIGRRIQFVPKVDFNGILTGYVDLSTTDYDFINIKDKSILIVGLGYVGLTLGLTLAEAGFSVNGFDINPQLIHKLENKQSPFYETGLQDFINGHIGKRFKLVNTIEQRISDIYIVSVGTPVDQVTKQPILGHIETVATQIGKVLAKDNLVILRSTVTIGCTRNTVIPILERTSGLKAGEDFHVAFCPERTAEGRALKELRYLPQIVGGLNDKSIELASRLFNEYTPTIITVQNLEAAELCKLLDNVYRDVKFAFANQVAELVERLGLNFNEIVDAVNLNYSRNDIPKPSPGVGGPCLTKDPYILRTVFEQNGLDAPLLTAARKINEFGPSRILHKADQILSRYDKSLKDSQVFVVGFAFKGHPETSDIRDSTTLWFLEGLKQYTSHIFGFDPVVEKEEIVKLGVEYVDVRTGFKNADAVFVMNNHRSYINWELPKLLKTMNQPALFFDAWHLFSKSKITECQGAVYAAVGESI